MLNLLWPIETDQYHYVDVTFDDDTTAVRPKWLVIGDSYYWEWQYGLPLDQLFESHHYWYYNNSVFNDPLHSNVNEVDLLRELLSTDVVMLLYSPSNLYELNRGFLTNSLFAFYYEEGVVEGKIEKIKQDIRNTPEWYASIEEKALADGRDVELALEENAKYLLFGMPAQYFEEFAVPEVSPRRNSRVAKVLAEIHDPQREAYRQQIFSNPEWLNLIKEKAEQKGIPLEQAVEIDIDWMIQNASQ